tara:strand:- start:5032 stop:8370 length:3339 start_codon:yes stop_codon:yes gene_type:complete
MVVFNRQLTLYGLTDDAHRSGDGWLDIKGIGQSDTDFTASDSIKIGRSTGSNKHRAVVRINLPTFPFDDANAEIVDLKLNLFCFNTQNDWADKIEVYRITKAVRMSNVSWSEYSDTSGENLTWTTAGATGADDIDTSTNYGHGANGIIDKIPTPTEQGWFQIDLGGLVRAGKIDWGMDSSSKYVFLLLKSDEGEALHNGEITGVQHLDAAPAGNYFATSTADTWCLVDGEHAPSDDTILCGDVDGGANAIQSGDIIAVLDYAPDTTQTWDTVEFMKVTNVNTSTNILTVERGFDGTTARTIVDESKLTRFANASPYLTVTYKNDYPTAPMIEVVPQDNGIDATIKITNTVSDKDLTGFITGWNTTLSSLAATGSNNTTVTTESAEFDSTDTNHVAANLLQTANTNYYVAVYSTDNEVDNPSTAHGAVASNTVTVMRPTISTSVLYTNTGLSSALGSDGSTNASLGQELYLKVVAASKIKKVYVNWDAGVSDENDDYVEYIMENISTTSSDGVQISHKYPDTGLHNVKVQVEDASGFRSGTTAARGTAITGHDPNISTSSPVAKISASRSKVLSSVYPDQTTSLVLSGAHSYAIGSDVKLAEHRFSYNAHRSTSDTTHPTTCTAHATSNDNTVFEESSSKVHIKAADSVDVSSTTTFKVYGLKSVQADGTTNVQDTSANFSHYVWDSATLSVSGTGDAYGTASSEYFKTIETVVGTVSTDGDDDGVRYVLSRSTKEDSYVDLNEALDNSETEVDVGDGAVFAVGDEIQVDDEIMLVVSKSGDTLTVHRGYQGTTPAIHSDNEDIYLTNHKINKDIRLKDRDALGSAQYGRWGGRAYYKANDGSGCVFTTSNDGIRIVNSIASSTGGAATSWLDHGFYVGDTIKIGGTSNNGTSAAPNTATIIDMLTGSATNDTILVDINLTDETVQAQVARSDHALKPLSVAIYNSASIDKVTFTLDVFDDTTGFWSAPGANATDTTTVTVSYPKTLDLDTELDAGNIAINGVNVARSGGLEASMPLGIRRYPITGARTSMGNPTLSCNIRLLNDTGFTKIFALIEGGVYDYVFLDTKKIDSPTTAFKSFKLRLLSGSINKTPDMASQYTASLQFAVVGEEEA